MRTRSAPYTDRSIPAGVVESSKIVAPPHPRPTATVDVVRGLDIDLSLTTTTRPDGQSHRLRLSQAMPHGRLEDSRPESEDLTTRDSDKELPPQ
eukprot:1195723-Prorocentrum_minimum.AAC.2